MTRALDPEYIAVTALANVKALGALAAAAAPADALVVEPATWATVAALIESEAERAQVAVAALLVAKYREASDAQPS